MTQNTKNYQYKPEITSQFLRNYKSMICHLLVIKVAKSQKQFHFDSNLQKRCQIIPLSTYHLPKEKMLRTVICHCFWRFEPK